MDFSDIISYLGPDWIKVNGCIRDALRSDIQLLESINENILSHSGKMLRPMLALLVAKACGNVTSNSVRFAATAEILHNATLLHDDVADDSKQRRGAATLYALMGPGCAVLAGDYWLARCIELVMESDCGREKAISLYARTLSDLAEGEMLQLQKADSVDTDEDDYFRIIYDKTASLFVAACESAAISVNAPPEYVSAAREFARNAGIAFQIKDDILDYVGTSELGKPTGADLRERKITLPLLGALKGLESEDEMREAVRNIRFSPESSDYIHSFVIHGNGVQYAAKVLDEYIEKAVKALEVLPESKAREYLAALARYNSYRVV